MGSALTSNTPSSNDEEDISNIPSLQMRIQIISQRLGIPADMPIEIINGGHGIKNPMSGPELTPEVKAATENCHPFDRNQILPSFNVECVQKHLAFKDFSIGT